MSLPTVTIGNYMAQSQANFNAFLTAFFDGNTHTIGTQTYTFPQCDIKFARQQLPRELPRPWIIVEPMPKANDKAQAGSRVRIRRDQQWRFTIVTQNTNQNTGPDWKVNDQICDLLAIILNVCRDFLSEGGQRIIDVGTSQRANDPAVQFSTITVMVRVDLVHDSFVAP